MRVRGIRHPYMWGRDHPLVVDTLIALGLTVFGVLTEITADTTDSPLREPDRLSMALTLASTLPLVARRRYPMAVLALVATLGLWHSYQEYPGGGPLIALLFALYAVAARPLSRRHAVGALVAVMIAATGLVVAGMLDNSEPEPGFDDWVVIQAFLVTAWVLGDNMRIRRAYIATVEERAERLERERDVEAQRAVLLERGRIARDLHDIVAHSMSVMLVQAGAARRTLDRDPGSSAEALGHIEATGRHAMEEMRRLVGVLREDGASASRLPQPGIDDIPVLLDQCREVGLDVDLRTEGGERPLPSGLELVVYRIVQEALTNTMKHAGPARAEVTFDYGEDTFRLTVVDDGRGAASTPVSAPGHGLAGMGERVQLYGGELTAGPQHGGGFRVSAELPLTPPTLAAAATAATTARTATDERTSSAADTESATRV